MGDVAALVVSHEWLALLDKEKALQAACTVVVVGVVGNVASPSSASRSQALVHWTEKIRNNTLF